MTAQIFDLAAERAKRAECPAKSPSTPPKWRISQRGNPYTALDGYHVVVYKRGPSWAFRIELVGRARVVFGAGLSDRGHGQVGRVVGGPAARTVAAAGLRTTEREPIGEAVRGNSWTRIGRAHIVIFPSRRTYGEWGHGTSV